MATKRDGKPRSNDTWSHFDIKDVDNCTALCNYCKESISFKTSVSDLNRHLRVRHNFALPKEDDSEKKEETVKHVSKKDVWVHFSIEDPILKSATCNLCNSTLSYQSTTTNLWKHLKRKHQVEPVKTEHLDEEVLEETENEDDEEKPSGPQSYTTTRSCLKPSAAWQYFNLTDDKAKLAVCLLCNAVCSYRTSVSNLLKHVRRRHNVGIKKGDDGDDETDTETNSSLLTSDYVKSRQRSIIWLYFKTIDHDAKLAQCLICKKVLSHSSTTTNLKKHLERRHPNVKIPGRGDGSKRVLLSAGGELYEVETNDKHDETADDDQIDGMDMETVYLEDLDSIVQEPLSKKPKLTKPSIKQRINNTYDTSSDDEVTFLDKHVKEKPDSVDYFGRYIASLLKQLPKDMSNQLQSDFIKQIMNAQLISECKQKTEHVTASDGNEYSVTISTDVQNVSEEELANT